MWGNRHCHHVKQIFVLVRINQPHLSKRVEIRIAEAAHDISVFSITSCLSFLIKIKNQTFHIAGRDLSDFNS